MLDYRAFYRGRKVMITGGLGFIGSNLVHALISGGNAASQSTEGGAR